MRMWRLSAVVAIAAWAFMPAWAQSRTEDAKKDAARPPEPSITQHSVTIRTPAGPIEVHYRATAGTLPVMDDAGKTRAHMFFIAYERLGEPGPDGTRPVDRSRPITFTFNGGPGSSSVWLHMGAMGPRRIVMGDEGEALPPPGRYEPNEHCWLDLTDLVFLDPVSTGFSRAVEGEDPRQFHGLDEDIKSVGDVIRLYTTRYERWQSPKFLVGESYGTTRAAGLSGYLQETAGMYLSGIALVSPVLHFQTIRFDDGNDTPYWLYLPTYTATAWFHQRLEPALQRDLRAAVAEAERFASGAYLLALAQGDGLPAEERRRVATELSRLTGLSVDFIERANLRVPSHMFTKELLREHGRTVGRLDSRFKGIDRSGNTASPDYDPSMAAIWGPFTAGFNAYVREELRYQTDTVYEILTGRVSPWSYRTASNRYANVAETLRAAMSRNPSLRVLVMCGYYDLATPHFAAEHTFRTMQLDPELRPNISYAYYESGHMMYIRKADLAKFKADGRTLYEAALGAPPAAR